MSQRPRFLTTVDWRPYMDGAEDNVRDRCMLQYLSEAQCEEAFELICEKYDLCSHCGKYGHDEAHCFEMWRAAVWCTMKCESKSAETSAATA